MPIQNKNKNCTNCKNCYQEGNKLYCWIKDFMYQDIKNDEEWDRLRQVQPNEICEQYTKGQQITVQLELEF